MDLFVRSLAFSDIAHHELDGWLTCIRYRYDPEFRFKARPIQTVHRLLTQRGRLSGRLHLLDGLPCKLVVLSRDDILEEATHKFICAFGAQHLGSGRVDKTAYPVA